MRPWKLLIIALWLLAGASVAGYALMKLNRPEAQAGGIEIVVEGQAEGAADEALPVLFPTPAFTLTDQHGETFSSEALEGKVWVGFVFLTNCPTGACPVMVSKMAKLQEALPDERVHFVSFSVDPERDAPETMLDYAREIGGTDVSPRWHLLTGESRDQMKQLAASMNLIVDEEFQHSTFFLLADGEGNVRGVFGNNDPEGMTHLRQAADELLARGGQ